MKHYGANLNQSVAGAHDTNDSSLISLNESSLDSKTEELNTANLSLQLDCQHCNLTFKSERLYNKHVNEVHKFESNSQQIHRETHVKRRKLNHSIVPDPEDPNFYCKSCDSKYTTRIKFWKHVRYMHKTVNLPLQRKPRSKPNHSIKPDPDDPNFYCKSCNTKYADIQLFRKHLHRMHKTLDLPRKIRPKCKPNRSVEPDPDNPNFYCKSCDSKYASSARFRKHIRDVHKNSKLITEKKTLRQAKP